MTMTVRTGLSCIALLTSIVVQAEEKQLFWGDLHIHTSFSMDAYVLNNQTTPADAYAFAKGAASVLPDGSKYRLARPLDFAAVTDHGEYFGLIQVCRTEPERPYCKALAVAAAEDSRRGFMEFFLPLLLQQDRHCLVDATACRIAEKTLWQRTQHAAQEANQPGEFTTFIASEWTASPGGLHWHRNLIYANNNVPVRPINSFDQPDQADMWRALRDQCTATGSCDVLAIPHNGNLGMGGSYNIEGHDAALLSLRARFEKLVEIHQHKGSSECYPQSGFSDEECAFEIALPTPVRNELRQNPRELTTAEHEKIASGYLRDTLARGLGLQAQQGINPFRFGVVGATDNHSGRPGNVEERSWFGGLGSWDDDAAGQQAYPTYNPGGLTAIWAPQNTRAELFAALQRREVYATSGPRIRLQFNQTFNPNRAAKAAHETAAAQPPVACTTPAAPHVPMGGTLGEHSADDRPVFSIVALMDRTPLAKVEIVKLQVTEDGIAQQIFKVAEAAQGRAQWCLQWQDEQYRKGDIALWYARVLQTPTPRWDGENSIAERAWSSPIWSVH